MPSLLVPLDLWFQFCTFFFFCFSDLFSMLFFLEFLGGAESVVGFTHGNEKFKHLNMLFFLTTRSETEVYRQHLPISLSRRWFHCTPELPSQNQLASSDLLIWKLFSWELKAFHITTTPYTDRIKGYGKLGEHFNFRSCISNNCSTSLQLRWTVSQLLWSGFACFSPILFAQATKYGEILTF